MTAAKTLLKDLDMLRDTRETRGVFAGVASGIVVGLSVLSFFAFCELNDVAYFLAVPVGLAFTCTTVSSIVAIRARTTGQAIAWTFIGNVVPPTVLCLPTILGVFYATPAGLIAFAVTLPLVLAARSVRAGDGELALGADQRERLVGAVALLVATVALLGVNLAMHRLYSPVYLRFAWDPSDTPPLALAAPVLGALATTVFAAMTAIPDLMRSRLADRIARGVVAGLESHVRGGLTHVNAVVTQPGGPMRSAESREALGAMVVSGPRAALGVMLSLSGGALLALTALLAIL